MISIRKWTASLLLAGTLISSLAASAPAMASSKGRLNTTLALGAVAAYELLKGKGTNALIAGAATAYAYKKYEDKKKEENRYHRYLRVRQRTRVRYRR